MSFGINIVKPITTATNAEVRTAPADKSLMTLADGWIAGFK